jgi:hypothetical protein
VIHQHILDMPAAVVADALGYHYVIAAKLATQAGDSWSRYAPGDHKATNKPIKAESQRGTGTVDYQTPRSATHRRLRDATMGG